MAYLLILCVAREIKIRKSLTSCADSVESVSLRA